MPLILTRIRYKVFLGHKMTLLFFFTTATDQILCSRLCSMFAGKIEFSEEEDAHVVADCVKVS